MSLATDLTQCQARLAEAGRKASGECRRLRGIAPVEIYDELMLHLCGVAACANDLKVLLGTLRMIGELEQRPAPVTAESLELAQCRQDTAETLELSQCGRGGLKPELRTSERDRMIDTLHRAGDYSLDDEPEQAGSLFHGKEAA